MTNVVKNISNAGRLLVHAGKTITTVFFCCLFIGFVGFVVWILL